MRQPISSHKMRGIIFRRDNSYHKIVMTGNKPMTDIEGHDGPPFVDPSSSESRGPRRASRKRLRTKQNERKPRTRARADSRADRERAIRSAFTYLRISGFGREIERLIGRRGGVLMGLHPDEGRLPRRQIPLRQQGGISAAEGGGDHGRRHRIHLDRHR